MAISGHSNKNTKNSDEEIEKLRETLLKKEKKFSEELEKLGKNKIGSKTIFSLIIILCSLFYYIKTRDQSIIQFNEKLNKESKIKDQKIDDLNKQFELKDIHLKQVLSDSVSKERHVTELNGKIALKDKRLEEVLFEVDNKNTKIIELENNLIKIQTEFNGFKSNCLLKDKQIDSLLNEKQLKSEEIDEKFIHKNLVLKAQNSSAKVLFGHNESTADAIVEIINECLVSEDIYNCFAEPKPEFDVYRNCFRDLSIILHNRLYRQLSGYWVVSTGTVDHCFTINVINESESEQYFLRIGDIYFEIFNYKDIFLDNQIKEDIPLKTEIKEEGNKVSAEKSKN